MSFLPIQSQAFLLYGNGAIIGDTTLVLSSFKDIDGNNISMQGTVMTGTVEPNSGSSEEQIIFTGVTQNSNGTATLTGVSSVTFASPYTQTSGFLKSHAGNTTFVLSDTSYLYSQYAVLGNTQTFTATDTFNISPFVPTVASTATTQAASVGYVNSIAISGSPKASNTVIGITELSVAPVTASVPIAVGDNDPRMSYVTNSESLALVGAPGQGNIDNTNYYATQKSTQIGSENFAITAGSSTAFTVTFSPVPNGYVKGERIYFQTNTASGTNPTINKNGLGAKNIYKQISTGTTNLAVGDMGTNQMNVASYDGAAYQLESPIANFPPESFATGQGTISGGTGSDTINVGFSPKLIEISCTGVAAANTLSVSNGTCNASLTQNCSYGAITGTTANAGQVNSIVNLADSSGVAKIVADVFSIGATSFVLSKKIITNTGYYQWKAYI